MENILLSSMLAQRGKAGGPVPVGGTEGQVIVKDSSTDFDVSWSNDLTDLKSAFTENGIPSNVFVANPNSGQISNALSKGVTVTYEGNVITLTGTATANFDLFASQSITPVSGTMYEMMAISDSTISALNMSVREGYFDSSSSAHQFSSDINPTNTWVKLEYPSDAVTSRTILHIPSGAVFSSTKIAFYMMSDLPINEQIDDIEVDVSDIETILDAVEPTNHFVCSVSSSQITNAASKGITVSYTDTTVMLSGTATSSFDLQVALGTYNVSHPEYERITVSNTLDTSDIIVGYGYFNSSSSVSNFVTIQPFDEFVEVEFPSEAVTSRVYIKIPSGKVFPSNTVFAFESYPTIPVSSKIESLESFEENAKDQSWNSAYHEGLSDFETPCKTFSTLMSGDTVNNVDAVSECESFVFFTDPHLAYAYGDNGVLENYMGQLQKVYNSTPTSFVIDGGDWLGNSATPEQASYWMGLVDGIRKSMLNPCYPVIGNHDTNYQGKQTSSSETYTTRFPTDSLKNFWFRKWGKTYYKFDGINTTFYCFDTQSGYGDTDDTALQTEQIAWFANDLLSTTAEHIAMVMHIYFGTTEMTTPSTFATAIMPIAAAYNARSTVTYSGVTYNYSSATGTIEFVLSGHVHLDNIATYTSGTVTIPVIVTADMGYHATYPETATFDLMFVDYDNRKIKMIRVGSGSDRETSLSSTS